MIAQQDNEITNIYLEDIIPNRFQPRLVFEENNLNELANSIKQHGFIQPIVVRKVGEKYEIIAGERRCKAAGMLGLQTIPAIVLELGDNESAEMAVVENIQREELNAIEKALSYKKLLDKGYATQEQIAAKMGITQATISNTLRLLSLPQEVQEALMNRKISERHARSLLTLKTKESQIDILNKIIKEKLTVKQTDEIINSPEKTILPDSSTPSAPLFQTEDLLFEEVHEIPKNLLANDNLLNGERNNPLQDPEESIFPQEFTSQVDVNNIKTDAVDINPPPPIPDFNSLLNIETSPSAESSTDPQPINESFENNHNIADQPKKNRFFPESEDQETNMNITEETPSLEFQTASSQLEPPFTPSEYKENEEQNNSIEDNHSPLSKPNKDQFNVPYTPEETSAAGKFINNPSFPFSNTPPPNSYQATAIQFQNTDLLLKDTPSEDIPINTKPETFVAAGLNLNGAIGIIRDTVNKIEKNGLIIVTEEFDFENFYQVIIKINK